MQWLTAVAVGPWIGAAAILLSVAAGGVGWWARGVTAERDTARLEATLAASRAVHAAALARAEADHREIESRRTLAVIRETDRAHADAAAARRDADRLARRLRDALATGAVSAGPAAEIREHPPPADGGPPAAGPGLVLSDLLGRSGARLTECAAALDQSRIAGLACERAYDAVRAADPHTAGAPP